MEIELYTFENEQGEIDGFTTLDPHEAKDYAQNYQLKWIANQYEFSDSVVVKDYTDPKEED